jgi:hypothetical protein
MSFTPDFRRTHERIRVRLQTSFCDVQAIEACGDELEALAGEVSRALEVEFIHLTSGIAAA